MLRDERVRIRPATSDDAVAIAAVASDVWPDEPLDSLVIQDLIAATERRTTVAMLDDVVVGFVDGFLTKTERGESRWEVDLLAVSPAAQGHGIGRMLVRACVDAAMAAGATTARGLVRIGNVASERVFAACGFTAIEPVLQLSVAGTLMRPAHAGSLHVVPVKTFRYEGVWLEAVTPAALRALQPASAGVTGALISVDDRDALAAANDAGLQRDGEFRFWQRLLSR